MCIAILKPKDINIDKEVLQTCCDSNPDGMGFAYVDNGVVHIRKYMNFDTFYNDYIQVENKSNMLIHFRIATHGKVEVDNCHPFKLNHRMALIHNGIISGYGDKQTKSDTRDFIDKVIGNISWKLWKNPSYRTLVGNAIGYSKFAILDASGEYYIINESKGVWDGGVWYSNTSYKPKVKPKQTSQMSLYSNNDWYYKEYHKQKELENKDDYVKWYDYEEDDDLFAIYKCKDCGKKFMEHYSKKAECDVCKSKSLTEIGYTYDGKEHYYEDKVGV